MLFQADFLHSVGFKVELPCCKRAEHRLSKLDYFVDFVLLFFKTGVVGLVEEKLTASAHYVVDSVVPVVVVARGAHLYIIVFEYCVLQ